MPVVQLAVHAKNSTLYGRTVVQPIFFWNWGLPSLLNRTKGQLKFPARGEDIALERVVEVVVHAKQQIRIVTQTVSVADVPAMKWLNLK